MNANTEIKQGLDAQASHADALIGASTTELASFAETLRPLKRALRMVMNFGDPATQKTARRLSRQLAGLEPSVTMIGQIKSGKTSLVNAMVGRPGLLPADVNPWTSVVTSLHLSPRESDPPTSAKFRFFEQDEWDRLLKGGGRIGELADRAGAQDELAKIKAQVEEMREKSKLRLGRKFEMLLGQEQSYGHFDKELIERYVCLGDEFEDGEIVGSAQGRFADITKSADLFFQLPSLPTPLCIRDTPGVNDTFMMREQITIQSIRDSRICAVVLSAHQALSSTDMALIRLIANVKSRDVIIFVNRIDELPDPIAQIPQIRDSIQQTLVKHKGPTEAEIIFGSALWAEYALNGKYEEMPKASREAFEARERPDGGVPSDAQGLSAALWEGSGLSNLYDTIGGRVAAGIGRELAAHIAVETGNAISAIRATDNLQAKAQIGEIKADFQPEDVTQQIAHLRQQRVFSLSRDLEDVQNTFDQRVDRALEGFLARATDALVSHLERYGDEAVWEYDPTGLRVLLNSSYKMFGQKCQTVFAKNAQTLAEEVGLIYRNQLGLPPEVVGIKTPPPPHVPPPVAIGKTIALDLKGNWWTSWWQRRRGYRAFAEGFNEMIRTETSDLIAKLKEEQADTLRNATRLLFKEFVDEQCDALENITRSVEPGGQKIDEILGLETLQQRDKDLTNALSSLEVYGA
ncbi:MAG: dynamin family protein [Pseudomonadota bacterium]